jgi:hypothetical protein
LTIGFLSKDALQLRSLGVHELLFEPMAAWLKVAEFL